MSGTTWAARHVLKGSWRTENPHPGKLMHFMNMVHCEICVSVQLLLAMTSFFFSFFFFSFWIFSVRPIHEKCNSTVEHYEMLTGKGAPFSRCSIGCVITGNAPTFVFGATLLSHWRWIEGQCRWPAWIPRHSKCPLSHVLFSVNFRYFIITFFVCFLPCFPLQFRFSTCCFTPIFSLILKSFERW